MVYHVPQQVFVMFGGFESTGLAMPQTHVFSPETYQWTISTAIGPSARFAHAMAFDPMRGRTVLFGGYDGVAPYLGDTWEFDGYAWVRHAGPGPSPRFYAALHWDDVLGGLRLTGGRDGAGALNDQWLLTSTGWHLIDEPLPTGPRWAHAAASSWDGNQLIIGGLDGLDATRSETLTVTRLPVVLSAPQNEVVARGQTVTLHVTVNDAAAQLTWLRNGQPVVASDRISGVQTAVLTIRYVQTQDEGQYSVAIANCAGTTVSASAMLSVSACDKIDFNNNGAFPEDQDVIDFFTVLSGGECSAGNTCNDIDFNNNGAFPEDQDVIDFFNVLAGGSCG
jgi:Immunoglobulin I-set domain